MEKRLLVMNGRRIIQEKKDGEWLNRKVDKAGSLKPGIYNLSAAVPTNKSEAHAGVVIHADALGVYLKEGKKISLHEGKDFDKLPEIGSAMRIDYNAQGKAVVAAESLKAVRSRSR